MTDVEGNRKIALLGDQARDLNKLVEYPEWAMLQQVFAETRSRAEVKMAREMLGGGEGHPVVDQREIDYRRGFLRGVQAVLDAPAHADTAFRQAMERKTSG